MATKAKKAPAKPRTITKSTDPKREAQRNKVIEVLNKARAMELFAIHQYMNQHYGLDDMDYGTLAADQKRIAIDEMNHAERFAERIKELDGEPTVQMDGVVIKGQDVHVIYSYDADVETDTIYKYNEFLKVCRENGDSVSAKLFEEIIEQEQKHLSYYDNVASHVEKLGATYLSNIAGTASDIGGVTKGFVVKGSGD